MVTALAVLAGGSGAPPPLLLLPPLSTYTRSLAAFHSRSAHLYTLIQVQFIHKTTATADQSAGLDGEADNDNMVANDKQHRSINYITLC